MAIQEALAAEAAAIRAYQSARSGGALGVNRAQYAGYKLPGMDTTKLFSDPCSILKDAEKRRASGRQYLWRKPDDPYTRSMVLRKLIRAVTAEEVDPQSPFANIDRAKILTQNGPREVVRTPGGLGLFEAPPGIELSSMDGALLPGRQWEAKYTNDMDDARDTFASDMETLTSSQAAARVSGEITTRDTQREMVV